MSFRERDKKKVVSWLVKNKELWEMNFIGDKFIDYKSRNNLIIILKNLDFYSHKSSNQDIRIEPLAFRAKVITNRGIK